MSAPGSVTTASASPLEQKLYRGWASIAFGIALAGALYPIVFVILGLGLEVLGNSGQTAPAEFAVMAILFIPYLVGMAVIGFLWAGFVLMVVLPIVHLVVWSLKLRGDIVWFGAFCGGLVGFVAVLPFFFVIASGGFDQNATFREAVTALVIGPALTTVLGQLGGAWGGKRAADWCRDYEGEVAAASVGVETDSKTAADQESASDGDSPTTRWQFGIRHLLWVAVWVSLLLSLIRLTGIPFAFALPLLVGWVAFQAASIWVGGLMLPRARAWWAAGRKRAAEIS